MANFAEIDENNNVIRVVSINDKYESRGEEYCNSLFGGIWKQTSYNNNIRKNYAGPGFTYDETLDAFIPPKPYNSWILDEEVCHWKPPVELPNDYFVDDYEWVESEEEWFSIRKYVYETYGNSYSYTDIQECCERFKLVDKYMIPILSTEDYVVSFEKIQNLVISHVTYTQWTQSVSKKWQLDYMENVIKKANCDLYAVWYSTNQNQIDTFNNYMLNETDYSYMETKNNWIIYKRVKYSS